MIELNNSTHFGGNPPDSGMWPAITSRIFAANWRDHFALRNKLHVSSNIFLIELSTL